MRVLLTMPPDSHGVYRELAAAPPSDVTFTWLSRRTTAAAAGGRQGARRLFEALRLPNLRVLPAGAPAADLVHSTQQLLITRRPWVVDLEHGQPFVGTCFSRLRHPATRRIVLGLLGAEPCRAILLWTPTAREAFVAALEPPEAIRRKLQVVYPAIRLPASTIAVRSTGVCRLLFVANRPEHNVLLKGGRELVKAFRQLRQRTDRVSLTIVGPVPDSFRARCDGVPGLELTGPLAPDVLETLYRAADLYVMPSASDTFGMVFLEAMAHGLPVVALNRPYTRDVVRHGETGCLVSMPDGAFEWCEPDGRFRMSSEAFIERIRQQEPDPRLSARLAEAIAGLVEDEPLRRRLSAAAREEVASGRFSVARRNAALDAVYGEAAAFAQGGGRGNRAIRPPRR